MRPIYIDIDPVDANLTGFASNVTGASWALTANSSGDTLAHRVSIRNDSATDHSGKTAILVGTDADGRAQTETIALPAGSATVESTKYFLTLTSVTPSATIGADTMDIGWVDEVASKTIPMPRYRETAPNLALNVTGTIAIHVDLTNDDVQVLNADQNSFLWVPDSGSWTSGVNADTMDGVAEWPVQALRVVVESYSSGAELQLVIVQAY